MKLKKMFICLSMVLVLVTLTAVPAFTADICTHAWEVTSERPATCQAEGLKIEKCTKCGVTIETPLQKTEHSYEVIREEPATCQAEGLRIEKCTGCGVTIETPLQKTGHSYEVIREEPATCKAEGLRIEKCTGCGATIETPLPKTDHSPAAAVRENEVPATAAAAGSYDSVVYCSGCHAELSRESMVIPASSAAELDDVPKTGDSTNMVIYGAAVLVSLLGISALLFKRKSAS